MLRAFVAGLAVVGFAQQATSQTFSADELARRTIERRAVEAVIWGMPAVNYDLMRQAALHEAKGAENLIVYWSGLPSWKNQTLTPNPDAVYLMPFFNTRATPMVLEIPPASDEGSITGAIDNVWQVPLEDVGPAGVDKGKGGKFLILPPGYNKDKAPKGYIALPSETYGGFALLRSSLRGGTEADVAKAVAFGKRVKLYPLTQAANPPAAAFVDAANVVIDGTIPYDLSYFQSLDHIVQTEPWLERDRAMIDQLRSLGIEKGKPFSPDPKTKEILERGAREANAWLDARLDGLLSPPYFEGTHWALPASSEVVEEVVDGVSNDFAKPDSYPVDGRGITSSIASIGIKHLEAGQLYLMTLRDKDGNALDKASSYHLAVPPKAPITRYWSASAYDRATHAFIRGMGRFSRSSQNPDLRVNCDGSVDLYFGPRNHDGEETNWIPTNGDGQFEVLFRFYGPEQPLLEKTWKLPDIEKVAGAGEKFEPTAITCPVTPENFVRAESDLNFGRIVKDGGFGKFNHSREPAAIDNQTVIRLNRDTLYSASVFDLDAGPVTITLPNSGKRFMSMQVIDEDEFSPEIVYGVGTQSLTKDKIGTRYVLVAVRAQVNPDDPKDLEAVHALQDAIKVDQPGGPGKFVTPEWDQASQKTVRDGLLMLATTSPDTKGMFGPKGAVDSVGHLIGAASAWGGNPEKDALDLNVVPAKNDGNTVYRLNVKDVPVDGFWSISVYNARGYFEPNPQNAYTLNNITAKRGPDGSIAIQFGGCESKVENCLPTPPGWNYLVRLYRPRAEVLDGRWIFPEAKPAD
jgi:hypothetical protein